MMQRPTAGLAQATAPATVMSVLEAQRSEKKVKKKKKKAAAGGAAKGSSKSSGKKWLSGHCS